MNPLRLLREGAIALAAVALWGAYSLYSATLRVTLVNPQVLPQGLSLDQNVIYVFWHSKTFIMLPLARHRRIAVLTLLDWQNRIYDRICRLFGYQTVPVRSPSAAAMRLKELLEAGFHVGLALDGPKGPAGVVKPGALYLAEKSGSPLVAVNVRAGRSLRLAFRWDRFEIPLPFTRLIGYLSEPMDVTREGWQGTLQRIREALPDL